MIKKESNNVAGLRRHARVRKTVFGTAEMPRLNVFRSNSEIYAQIIDDEAQTTLVSSSSVALKLENGGNIEAAKAVGADIAKKANEEYLQKKSEYENILKDGNKCETIKSSQSYFHWWSTTM